MARFYSSVGFSNSIVCLSSKEAEDFQKIKIEFGLNAWAFLSVGEARALANQLSGLLAVLDCNEAQGSAVPA